MSLRGARKFSVTGSSVSRPVTSPIFTSPTDTDLRYGSFSFAAFYKDTERSFRDTDPLPTRGRSKAFSLPCAPWVSRLRAK
jgi:hypothetical protein